MKFYNKEMLSKLDITQRLRMAEQNLELRMRSFANKRDAFSRELFNLAFNGA